MLKINDVITGKTVISSYVKSDAQDQTAQILNHTLQSVQSIFFSSNSVLSAELGYDRTTFVCRIIWSFAARISQKIASQMIFVCKTKEPFFKVYCFK